MEITPYNTEDANMVVIPACSFRTDFLDSAADFSYDSGECGSRKVITILCEDTSVSDADIVAAVQALYT